MLRAKVRFLPGPFEKEAYHAPERGCRVSKRVAQGPVAEMSRTAQVDAGNVQPSGVIDPDSGLGRLPRLTARRSFEVAGAGSSPAGTTERKYRND